LDLKAKGENYQFLDSKESFRIGHQGWQTYSQDAPDHRTTQPISIFHTLAPTVTRQAQPMIARLYDGQSSKNSSSGRLARCVIDLCTRYRLLAILLDLFYRYICCTCSNQNLVYGRYDQGSCRKEHPSSFRNWNRS